MLADVVDVDSMRSGGKRAGTYFALMGMTTKIAIALGTGVSPNVVGLLGFDAAGAWKPPRKPECWPYVSSTPWVRWFSSAQPWG